MWEKDDYAGRPLIGIDERRVIELGILEKFDAFARENGLAYWLFWGTLLGAVRHRGFIPWDDDIDIAMPQRDYLRLLELVRENPAAMPGVRLNAFELNRSYARPFAKLCDVRTVLFEDFDLSYVEEGVYVDVFPLVPVVGGEADLGRLRRRWRKDFVFLGLSKGRLVKAKSPLVTAAKVVLKPFAERRGYEAFVSDVCRDLDSVACEFGDAHYAVCVEETATPLETAWFSKTVRLPFEHLELPAPAQWDTVLTRLYGDYRQLPPEDERTCHPSVAYWKLEDGDSPAFAV